VTPIISAAAAAAGTEGLADPLPRPLVRPGRLPFGAVLRVALPIGAVMVDTTSGRVARGLLSFFMSVISGLNVGGC